MAGLVLVLACINVANLLYARSLRQSRELAVRAALGASRGRLVQQSLCLNTLLAGLGAAGGTLLATWCLPLLKPLLADPRKPYWLKLEMNGAVLAMVVGLTIGVALLAGLLTAWRAMRLDVQTALRDGCGTTGRTMSRVSRGFAIGQIALAGMVLVEGTVLGRGVVVVARDVTPPFASQILEAAGLAAPPRNNPAPGTDRLLPLLEERASGLPGVQTAAMVQRGLRTPIVTSTADDPATREGSPQYPSERFSAGYFDVFGIKALRGRVFSTTDVNSRAAVVVINESAARQFWPDANPIGARLRFQGEKGLLEWHTVIGVVPDLPMSGGRFQRHVPGVYGPLELDRSAGTRLLLRTSGDPAALVLSVRKLVRELAPDQPFQSVMPLMQSLDEQLRVMRLISGLAAVFGGAAMLLAALGIFGVQAFLVESRRREFGVRIALGATTGEILCLVLGRGVAQLVPGIAAGMGLGWGLNRLLQNTQSTSLFALVTQLDGSIIAIVATVLGSAVLLACWVPARRATKMDPMIALRAE